MSLLQGITEDEIKKIMPNVRTKREYLQSIEARSATDKRRICNADINANIIQTWEYDKSKNILREMFRKSEKYERGRQCKDKVIALQKEWHDLGLGEFDWPFQPRNFDQFVHRINRKDCSEEEKDKIISESAIKFRRIKDINACRNDYIEYLIFEKCDNVIPTFGNARGVDFYINGVAFDQKVGRSVGKNFIEKWGDEYREKAIRQPELVAQCLYEYQDEERFGSEPRLFVVYLDADLSIDEIESCIEKVDFDSPYKIDFEYAHSSGKKLYSTECYVILLHR